MLDFAKKYFDSGLSVVPTDGKKKAIGRWKIMQTQLVPPNGNFKDAAYMAIIGGAVSSPIGLGLECVDIDCKYDLTGVLFNEYKKVINDNAPQLLKKLVVQKTQNGGYHFIYRCKKWEGNQKLAKRPTVELERQATYDETYLREIAKGKIEAQAIEVAKNARDTDTTRDLIETRGEGGYFLIAPSNGYELVYGDILKINEITEEERDILFSCAKTFNTFFQIADEKNYVKNNTFETGLSPFDDYNKRGNVPEFLESYGWSFIKETNGNMMFLRPSGTGSWSAGWHEEKRVFYVFTTSTEFDSTKGYNAVGVIDKLKFKGDWSACAKWLREKGYGDKSYKKETAREVTPIIKKQINALDYIANKEITDKTVLSLRNNTYPKGLSTGIPTLDPYFLFKRGHFNIINGHDNVGKTSVLWYLAVLSAIKHNWNWIILSMENKSGALKRKLMEFYVCKKITEMTDEEYNYASKFIDEHFTILKNNILWTYIDVMSVTTELLKTKKYDSLLIDPYNGLVIDSNVNRHDWDSRATIELRQYADDNDCSIWVNCHPHTEAMRKKYPKEHPTLAGYLLPPEKADTEGGTKFAGKADDFLTIHRHPHHPSEWMWTELYVKKIRDVDMGGKYTMFEQPVRIKMNYDRVGFEDANGYNPILQKVTGHISTNPKDIHPQEINPNSSIEPKHHEEELDNPF